MLAFFSSSFFVVFGRKSTIFFSVTVRCFFWLQSSLDFVKFVCTCVTMMSCGGRRKLNWTSLVHGKVRSGDVDVDFLIRYISFLIKIDPSPSLQIPLSIPLLIPIHPPSKSTFELLRTSFELHNHKNNTKNQPTTRSIGITMSSSIGVSVPKLLRKLCSSHLT